MSKLEHFLKVGEHAARQAGATLLDWHGQLEVREKRPADLVTAADVASQDVIQKIVLGEFPSHGFLSEENVSIPPSSDGYRWIVDPLDGTTNYVHGIPYWSVSIALAEHDRIIAAVVYQPTVDECFTASHNGGAFLNGVRTKVSDVATLDEAVVAMSLPAGVQADAREIDEMCALAVRTQSLRRMGSAAINLAYVATGRFDAYWTGSTRVWDVAAGVLLVLEAGGTVCNDCSGQLLTDVPRFVAAANDQLHRELVDTIATARSGS